MVGKVLNCMAVMCGKRKLARPADSSLRKLYSCSRFCATYEMLVCRIAENMARSHTNGATRLQHQNYKVAKRKNGALLELVERTCGLLNCKVIAVMIVYMRQCRT